METAFPSAEQKFSLFTDASDVGYGAVLVQAPFGSGIDDGRFVPLAFRSGLFSGSQKNWSVGEKEAFAILDAVGSLHYLHQISRYPLRIMTDHRNLEFILNPSAVASSKTHLARLERWAICMQPYNYGISHVEGSLNLWTDFLSRNFLHSTSEREGVEASKNIALTDVLIGDSNPEEMQLDVNGDSIYEELLRWHLECSRSPTPYATRSVAGFWKVGDAIYIPSESNFRDRFIRLGHYLHPSTDSQVLDMRRSYYWESLAQDVKDFCRDCFMCQVSDSVVREHALGSQLHARVPDEIMHFDFLQLETSIDGFEYLLVIKDDFSGWVELFPSKEPSADCVADALVDWNSRHSAAKIWISDNGSHFKNHIMERLAETYGVDHHYTAPYSPWANGSVERVNRVVNRLFRVLLAKKRLNAARWHVILNLVVTGINMVPSRFRSNKSPFELYTGRIPRTPSDVILSEADILTRPLNSDEIASYLEQFRIDLDKMHEHAYNHMDENSQELTKVLERAGLGEFVCFV